MMTTEPRRTAELAGAPSYLEGGGDHAGHSTDPPTVPAANGMTPLRRLDLRDFLAAVLRVFAEDDASGKVLAGPIPVRAEDGASSLTPDVLFIADEHLDRLRPDHLAGPADLAVDIAAVEGWTDRRSLYESTGVREYWLVDPVAGALDCRARADSGEYVPVAVEESGIFRSRVLPLLWMRTEWLFSDPPPPVRTVLIEWGLPRLFAD